MFTDYQNILPTPSFKIGDAGQNEADGGNTAGPGYASVKLSSNEKVMKNRTNSGRYTARTAAYHMWKINISYNPMTQAEFMPVYTFLLEKQGSLKPFFVSLPQYEAPSDATFASFGDVNLFQNSSIIDPGDTSFLIARAGYNSGTNGKLSPGDLFNITDTSDSNHKKAYMVTRVEDNVYYTGTQPTVTQLRIHTAPAIVRTVSASSTLVLKKDLPSNNGPLIKVVANDLQEYSLGTNNLYQFSLSLEEVQ